MHMESDPPSLNLFSSHLKCKNPPKTSSVATILVGSPYRGFQQHRRTLYTRGTQLVLSVFHIENTHHEDFTMRLQVILFQDKQADYVWAFITFALNVTQSNVNCFNLSIQYSLHRIFKKGANMKIISKRKYICL